MIETTVWSLIYFDGEGRSNPGLFIDGYGSVLQEGWWWVDEDITCPMIRYNDRDTALHNYPGGPIDKSKRYPARWTPPAICNHCRADFPSEVEAVYRQLKRATKKPAGWLCLKCNKVTDNVPGLIWRNRYHRSK